MGARRVRPVDRQLLRPQHALRIDAHQRRTLRFAAQADLDQLLDIPGGEEGVILSAVLLEGESVPPAGTPVTASGRRAGELRSCVRSLGIGSVIGLASVATDVALPGAELDLAGIRATITAKPFLRRRS